MRKHLSRGFDFTLKVLIFVLAHPVARIKALDAEIVRAAKKDEVVRRPVAKPGIGPLITTRSPRAAARKSRKVRDFAA